MKILYLFLLVWFPVFCISCYEDKGNYGYRELNQAEVSGIETTYRRDLLSQLTITPVVSSKDKNRTYDYMWMYYRERTKGLDTLSYEKDLNWNLALEPAVYQLIFAYRDRQTDVTKQVYAELTVESKYSRGWYVMKQKGQNTDLDFFSPEFENSDLMLKTRGNALAGKPQCLGFVADYAYIDEEKGELVKNNMSLVAIAENELQMVRISDMQLVGDFNTLFYEEQSRQIPQKWFGGSDESGLINDGQVYTIDVHGSPLGSAKFAYAKGGDYHVANLFTKNGTMCPLLFDTKSSRFCTVNRGNPNLIYLASDDQSKFPAAYPDMEPVYAGFLDEGMWAGGKGYVVMQKKDGDKPRSVLHFDLKCLVNYDAAAFKNRIMAIDEIPAVSAMAGAECFGMSRTFQMLYFSKGDKLYYFDLQNKQEHEVKSVSGQTAVPAGERIVLIKHIIFDNSYSAPDEYTNKLVVATGNGNHYKLYLFETTADKVKDGPIVYQGEGVPSEVMYMSSKMGNGYLCY